MLNQEEGAPTVIRRRLPIFNEIAPIAKLSISSSKNVFVAKKFRAQGVTEQAPISNSHSNSPTSAGKSMDPIKFMARLANAQSTFPCAQKASTMGADGAEIMNVLQSLSKCTNFGMPMRSNFDSQEVPSRCTN
jgi:hypothetical protein